MTYTIDEVFAALEQARREQYEATRRAEYLETLARKMLTQDQGSVESLEHFTLGRGWLGVNGHGCLQHTPIYH